MIAPVVLVLFQVAFSGGIPAKGLIRNEPGPICLEPECVIASGAILSALDQTADPCHDFYRYACGGWLDRAEIPPWAGGISKSFGELSNANLKIIKTILEGKASTSSPPYTALQKARDYYTACMDVEGMETSGATPLLMLIETFGGWGLITSSEDEETITSRGLLNTLIAVQRASGVPLFSMRITADDKDSTRNIIQFVQDGLWLGSRQLYLGGHEDLLETYVELGVTLAGLLAEDNGLATGEGDFIVQAESKMRGILDFEKQLAGITIPKHELRDSWKTYHKMTLDEFSQIIPDFDVFSYVNYIFGMEISKDEEILVPTLAYFPKMNELIKRTPLRVVHDYMVWHTVVSMSEALSEKYRDAVLRFQRVYSGISAVEPRWMSCAGAANDVVDFATGAEFVKKRNSIAIKDEVKAIIGNVRQTFIDSLPSVDWMDEATRNLAAEKAQALKDKVVGPSWMQDTSKIDDYYHKLDVAPNSFFSNILSATQFYRERNLAKFQKPVDKTEWVMSPAEVNAYYSPTLNQMVFPAGILQTPFYDPVMPMSVNYGSIGWVAGHELTHGFDDQGRNYDEIGNLHNWWKNESAQAYKERAQCVQQQYSGYTSGDMHVNGLLTLGENIADNGGLRLALQAYHKYREVQGGQEARLPGLQDMTPEQIFFIGAGQTWCKLDTPEVAMLKLLRDAHSPGKYRVIGPFSNMEEFSEAFQCPPGSFMNPRDKCRVW